MKTLKFTLPISPLANKETMISQKGFSYTPAEKKKYMKQCAAMMANFKDRFKGVACIKLSIVFVCDRPRACPVHIPSGLWKSMSLQFYKSTRPDIDNYLKPIQDSMSNQVIEQKKNALKVVISQIKGAGIIDDDSNIVSLTAKKVYRKLSQNSHIQIKITELNYIYE